MDSNSVCNHTRDSQIGLPLRGRLILLITRMITDRIGLHSALLQLINLSFARRVWQLVYSIHTTGLWVSSLLTNLNFSQPSMWDLNCLCNIIFMFPSGLLDSKNKVEIYTFARHAQFLFQTLWFRKALENKHNKIRYFFMCVWYHQSAADWWYLWSG